MSSGVEVGIDPRELQALLRRARSEIGDLSATMAIVAEQLVSAVNDEFETAGHGSWPGLADSTLAGRRGSSAQILVDTGRFAGSIRGDSGADYAEAATDVSYAVFHVSDAPRSLIPLRNPFDIPDAVLDDAMKTIVQAIVEKLTA